MTKLEQVARAIDAADQKRIPDGFAPLNSEASDWAHYIARAAIEALREPDPAVIEAMAEALAKPRVHVGHMRSDKAADAVIAYNAMIDAILTKETDG